VRLFSLLKIFFTLELILITSWFNKFPDNVSRDGGSYEDRRDLIASTKKGFLITENGMPQLMKAFAHA